MLINKSVYSRLLVQALFLLLLGGTLTLIPAQHEDDDLMHKKPVFITARVFQGRIKRGSKIDLSDQTFRISNGSLSDYDKLIAGLGKAYPGLEIALVKTELMRIFPSPNPGRLLLGTATGRNLQFLINVAYSPGDGVTPGLSIIPVVEYHFGDKTADRKYPPVTQAFPVPIEAEPGMTYFFTNKDLSYSPETYVSFLRPSASVHNFQTDEYFLIFAVTHNGEDPQKPGGDKPTARFLDDQQSAALQATASKKVEPEWPAAIQKQGYDGSVEMRVLIDAGGRVTHADIWNSSLPEANRQAIAAALQWQFPTSHFAESRLPINALISFTYTSPAAAPGSPAGQVK